MDRVSRTPPDFDTRPHLEDAHCYSCDTKNLFNSGSTPPPIPSTNSNPSKSSSGKSRSSSASGTQRAHSNSAEERPAATYVYHCWKCSVSLCPGCSLRVRIVVCALVFIFTLDFTHLLAPIPSTNSILSKFYKSCCSSELITAPPPHPPPPPVLCEGTFFFSINTQLQILARECCRLRYVLFIGIAFYVSLYFLIKS